MIISVMDHYHHQVSISRMDGFRSRLAKRRTSFRKCFGLSIVIATGRQQSPECTGCCCCNSYVRKTSVPLAIIIIGVVIATTSWPVLSPTAIHFWSSNVGIPRSSQVSVWSITLLWLGLTPEISELLRTQRRRFKINFVRTNYYGKKVQTGGRLVGEWRTFVISTVAALFEILPYIRIK